VGRIGLEDGSGSAERITALREASRELVRALKVVNGCGLVPGMGLSECHVLVELERRGSLNAAELVELLVLEKSTVSRLVQGLLDLALIRRDVDPEDRRRRRLFLTDAGCAQVAAIHAAADRDVGQALEYLEGDEALRIAAGLERYARALRYARRGDGWRLRPIEARDDAAVAAIIRDVMTEFGAVGPAYSIDDPEVEAMTAAYADERSAFFVIEDAQGTILGCGGVAPLVGADEAVCELRKMYFRPELRGTGMGSRLMVRCLEAARERGFETMYLETLDRMEGANRLYRKFGFEAIGSPLGTTGHCGCDRWMTRGLGEGSGKWQVASDK